LIVNDVPAAHACVTWIVIEPDPVNDTAPGVQVPELAVVFDDVGWVQPVGTAKVTYELDGKLSATGAVKVKPSWLVVDPSVTDVGDTVIVPCPLVAVPVIRTAVAGEEAEPVTWDVVTLNVEGPYDPAAGFVMPATVNCRFVWLLLMLQEEFPPSVITTEFDVVTADATVQPPKLFVKATVGVAGTPNDGSNCTVTEFPELI
jgi:hypothetical protein